MGKGAEQTNDSGVAGIVSPQETILLLAHRGGIILLDNLNLAKECGMYVFGEHDR